MKKKNIYWWYRWFSLHGLFAIGFAVSGAVFPILYQRKSYWLLLFIWFWGQLSGRFQVYMSLDFFKDYQDLLFQRISFGSMDLLCHPAWKNKYIHHKLRALSLQERKMELLCYQVLPQAISFIIRIYIIYILSGLQYGLIFFVLISCCVIQGFSHMGKKASLKHEEALQNWYQSRYDMLYQVMHYKAFKVEIEYPKQAIMDKEWIKVGIGLWVFIVLIIGLSHQKMQGVEDCLVIISWLGISDHIWAMWQTYVEWLGLPILEVPVKKKNTEINIESISLDDVQVFENQIPINIHLSLGEVLWIKGANGSGKTSLLKALLSGNTYSGKISINHQNVLMESVCVLNSDMVVRNGKLRDYISWEEAKYLKLDVAIASLPYAMGTDVHTLHNKWSKGMLQKLNLAWASAQKSSVYLLDEACCHIPINEEVDFYKRLSKKNNILILISHLPEMLKCTHQTLWL